MAASLRRVLLTAILAGMVAALAATAAQRVAVVPLIRAAERYERAALAGPAGAPDHEPAPTLLRTLGANLAVGVGYGLVLAAAFLWSPRPPDARRGLLWGMAGFAIFALAPALGLPPALPGAAEPPVAARQVWWLATVAATAGGMALMALAPPRWAKALGVVLLALPHLWGAPLPPPPAEHGPPVALARAFVAASLGGAALFWLGLGGAAG
ncbi:MAG: CbtA family protein [Candidatus Lambdaproteobacteria bacterium]|nr:CbtA family protein [Candidatus Lambdaproteobacteria bacterium]